MLLSKGLFNLHITPQRSKEPTRFRFPAPKPKAVTRSRSDESTQVRDRPRTGEGGQRAEGVGNVVTILGKKFSRFQGYLNRNSIISVLILAVKFALSNIYSIPLPNLPAFNNVIPSRIPRSYFFGYLFPSIGMFGKSHNSLNLLDNNVCIQEPYSSRG